jgi:undecaprenyl-diphosphatase
MDILYSLDKFLFYAINLGSVNRLFDIIMPFITERNNWFLLYIYVWVYLFWKGGKNGRITAVLIILAIIASDQVSASILKPLVSRVRPCYELEGVRTILGCGGRYGFPSSHAANYFAAATIFTYYFPKYKWIYISIAVLVCFSRIYIGVHYPSDVICGAILGFLSSVIIIIIYNEGERLFFKMKHKNIQ